MSKNKREKNAAATLSIGLAEVEPPIESSTRERNSVLGYLKNRIWVFGAIGVLSLGVLGAGLKYLEEDAKKQNALMVKDRSSLSSVNPFVVSPPPTPTPQLSKEYLYAGSRLLAVEDANANAAPPADLAVWRPSTGVWYVLGGPGSAQTFQEWGQSGDVAVPGDYDGDGKTDFCIFRTGTWWIVNSSTGATSGVGHGQSGDRPYAADFDGDGKSDLAVYRNDTPTSGLGTWYVLNSNGSGVTTTQFGLNADEPAPADFDGDGRADVNVWRDSNYTFYTLYSTTSAFGSLVVGSAAGDPVPSDYDGDGKANYAVKSGADWKILNAAGTSVSTTTPSGDLSSDVAVQNDYDGDGKTDIAVWRSSNGNWYIRKSASSNALRQEHWGQSGDIPVPAFYRR